MNKNLKTFTLLAVLFLKFIYSQAQKTVIDTSVYDKWPSVEGGAISNDGRYVTFKVGEGSVFSRRINKLVVQANNGKWSKELTGVEATPQFTADSKKIIFAKSKDSLAILTLGSDKIDYILNVSSFRLIRQDKNQWLAYQFKDDKKLILKNLATAKEMQFSSVTNFAFSKKNDVLILQKETKNNAVAEQSIDWITLPSGKAITIWKGTNAFNIVLDDYNRGLAFLVSDSATHHNSIWYYNVSLGQAKQLTDARMTGIDSSLEINNITTFSIDGSIIFFNLKEKAIPKADSNAVRVTTWSYTDAKIQPLQLNELAPATYLAVINIRDRRIIRLQNENESVNINRSQYGNDDTYAIVSVNQGGDFFESHWNTKAMSKRYLLSTKDGSRQFLGENYFSISPSGKYLIYFDTQKNNYFTRDIASGIVYNITKDIPAVWTSTLNTRYDAYPIGVTTWMKNDEFVFLYDEHDIWQVDPAGKKPPVCLTNGYGKKNNIVLRLSRQELKGSHILPDEKLLLAGFNRLTKENGFLFKKVNKQGDPELLTMGNYTYWAPQKEGNVRQGTPPVKAKDVEVYLIERMSAKESPNYFWTTDFKTFNRISDIHPEKKYNWCSSELLNWTSLDGTPLQGVLYKPENFDPNKKYPVIFYYYELLSDDLNSYHEPGTSGNGLNITSYVSNGYLVFTPDIVYKIGEPMQSTYNCVISGAQHLATLPFVNTKKMGIQGISWGGVQTNYLVTHTDLFAAACSASGTSNFISHYGATSHGDHSCQATFERGQLRVGAMLWERPEWYIKNSPIMSADKVTTPFLIFHTSVDDACPFPQAVELFTALRRLGKKAWMLEYQDGNHAVMDKPAIDFSIRLSQFFDHYLKDAPPPKWMTRGIPAKLKGIETGLELDLTTKTPGGGLLDVLSWK